MHDREKTLGHYLENQDSLSQDLRNLKKLSSTQNRVSLDESSGHGEKKLNLK
jgi:hypothetical protein